jgi:hypothetical protein
VVLVVHYDQTIAARHVSKDYNSVFVKFVKPVQPTADGTLASPASGYVVFLVSETEIIA